ncbi:hypothetical protein FOZ62_017237 [Perkinsus olseni]|uniref:Uncharacterized protein n=2 Tax=Perkinsus olseni TaxID=32597 RepID=A0A7J6U6S2_PEROL|nr:hypothetical protein FOZ62_017237 [Perkinsus olseni]
MKVFRGNKAGNLAPLKAGFKFEDRGGLLLYYFYELAGHFEDGPKKPYNGPLPVLPEVVAELFQPAEH